MYKEPPLLCYNMERNAAGLFLFLLIIAGSSPPAAGNSGTNQSISRPVLIEQKLSWGEAWNYCREHHSDLIIIRNKDEAESIRAFKGWIGLYRTRKTWYWSNWEQANFFLWKDDPGDEEDCAYKHDDKEITWEGKKCREKKDFICSEDVPDGGTDDVILVEEEKVWEQALIHCREHLLPAGEYDLISKPKQDLDMTNIDTEVWVGLRFLAGQWYWMNGHVPQTAKFPSCPSDYKFCGVLEPNSKQVTYRDCAEKKFFLCSKNLHL